jgi:hypothetical protein
MNRPQVYKETASQGGVSLIEIVVSMMLWALVGATAFTAIAYTVPKVEQSESQVSEVILAQSQLDFVVLQPFREDGLYGLLPAPPGKEVALRVKDIRPGLLQEITLEARDREAGGKATISAYKANRLTDVGQLPQADGLEGLRSLSPPLLGRGQGWFQVMEVLPTAARGELRGFWQLATPSPHHHLKGEGRDDDHGSLDDSDRDHAHHHHHYLHHKDDFRWISVSIYAGTAFGPSPSGLSTTPPEQVLAPAVSRVENVGIIVEAFAQDLEPGLYTLYLFNKDTKTAVTQKAAAACICAP